jgi:hypothetical protein
MRFLLLLLGIALLTAAPRATGAQLSPGPLARPHASLDGTLGCTQCHGGRREPTTSRCLACHEEIAWLTARGRGLHARDAKGACASCHPDHAGRDFALINWPDGSRERFDHARAGWTLTGSHTALACDKCHTATLRISPAASLSPGGRRSEPGWIGLERHCTSCHDDVHRGALTTAASRRQCTTCHDTREWNATPGFDHANTRYPLTGKHTRVECDGCHRTARLKPARGADGTPLPVFSPVPFRDCRSCHEDPHAGRLAGTCGSCHSTTGFRFVTGARFDHDRTRYPLRGRHARVECASCHTGIGRRRTNPPFAGCTSCHANAHGTQLASRSDGGACESCHGVAGWTPTTFRVAQHGGTGFPLDGSHALAECGACHGPSRPGLPPLASEQSLGTARIALRLEERACGSCHTDPHEGRLTSAASPTCTSCHDTRGFRPSSLGAEAHAQFAFRLEGAHLAVPCAGCHRELQRARARSTLARAVPAVPRMPLTVQNAGQCATCHRDPHEGEFATRGGGSCETCHTVAAFVPASRFDHDRDTDFPLTEGHAGVGCAQCHRAVRDAGGRTRVPYRISSACERCHATGTRPPPASQLPARKGT